MRSVDARTAEWVEVVSDLLAAPLTALPVEPICRHVLTSFDAEVASVVWRRADGVRGVDAFSRRPRRFDGMSLREAQEFGIKARFDHHNPLVHWFLRSGNPQPQSLGRVPPVIAWTPKWHEIDDLMRAWEINRQLSIPLDLSATSYVALVIHRPGPADYSREDMAVAGRIQPLLRALRQQTVLLQRLLGSDPAASGVLSPREVAVLGSVAEGLTAQSVSRRLGISVHTVNKHLENLYRKLGVNDRVSAVRRAEALQLVRRTQLQTAGSSAGDQG